VVPLAAGDKFDAQWQSRALERFGKTTLFQSQDALDGLKAGALRIAPESFVLHVLDQAAGRSYRFNSASGVAKLSSREIASDGPFRIRLQTAAADPSPQWNNVVAEGRGSCHWVFALIRP
jgi:hypothetical protein